MPKHLVRAVVLIALSVPLGACNSFLGIHFARQAPKAERIAVRPANAAAAPATEFGRRQLADGQIGLAVESFRKALESGEPAAPAINGMGVAYARLGNFELALRYFQRAMEIDPANGRYAANLARLTQSPAFAMRRERDLAAAALASAAKVPTGQAGPSEERVALGKIERISRGEVRITTAAPQPAPTRTATHVDQRFRPLIRISFAGSDAAGAAPTPARAAAAGVDKRFRPLVRVPFTKPRAAPAMPDATAKASAKR